MRRPDALFTTINVGLDANRTPEEIADDLWRLFGETVSVFVCDSTGFTRTTRVRGIAFFLSVIEQLRQRGEEIFTDHPPLDWRAEADNLFASFKSADRALEAAFRLHRSLSTSPIWLSETEPLGACIGIGFGRLLRSEHEGHYGDEMNLASKLGEDIADRGETLLTEAAFAALSSPDELDIERRQITVSGVTVSYYALWPRGERFRR